MPTTTNPRLKRRCQWDRPFPCMANNTLKCISCKNISIVFTVVRLQFVHKVTGGTKGTSGQFMILYPFVLYLSFMYVLILRHCQYISLKAMRKTTKNLTMVASVPAGFRTDTSLRPVRSVSASASWLGSMVYSMGDGVWEWNGVSLVKQNGRWWRLQRGSVRATPNVACRLY